DGQVLAPGSSTTFNYLSQYGCDSTIVVDVVENPSHNTLETFSACAGTSITYDGLNIPAGTQEIFNYTTQNGCDSTVTVSVAENPVHLMSETFTACAGTFVDYNGTSILAGTQQTFNYQNQFGCDSTIAVTVLSNPVFVGTETFTACTGTSITFDGVAVLAGTQSVFNYTTQDGCDSTVTVIVNANPVDASAATIEACSGSSIVYDGVSINAGDQEIFNYQNQYGCDSIVTITVTSNPVNQESVNLDACAGETVVFDGQPIAAGAQQDFLYQNQYGCDSIVTVIVAANPVGQSDLTLEACAGSTVMYNGLNLNAGTQQAVVLTNQWGCDSTVNVTVTANPLSTGAEILSACSGTSIIYDGISILAGTQETINYQNQWGCDSIVTVSVLENPVYDELETLSACAGSDIVYDGTTISAGSQVVFNYQSQTGCDSIVTVAVLENPVYNNVENRTACQGSSITFDGVSILAGSQQIFTYASQLGCDSIVTVNVSANPVHASSEVMETCAGTSIDYQGVSIAAGTQQDFTLSNQYCCDSTVTIIVQAQPLSQTALTLETCLGTTVDYNGDELEIETISTYTFTNQFGCDSVVEVSVLPYPDFDFILESNVVCENTWDGVVQVEELVGGVEPFAYAIEQLPYQDSGRFDNLAAGIYTIFIQDANGCVRSNEIEVQGRAPLQVQIDEVVLGCQEDSVLVSPLINGSIEQLAFQWPDGSTNPYYYAKQPGNVSVVVSNVCEEVEQQATVFLEEEGRTSYLYVPNAFSPNDDSFNDSFRAYPALSVDITNYQLEVFDRWGNKVFESKNINQGWRGLRNSRRLINPGVFIWQLRATIQSCGRMVEIHETGDVTLLR
ncbi:MAG: gliding motility-associated C-terminal domain-containing protein, partial [Bacteroidota bacterium]